MKSSPSFHVSLFLLIFSSSINTIICSANITLRRMDTKEIAPNVHMPVMSIGCGGLESRDAHEIVANWLELFGEGTGTVSGIDTALNYGNQDQVQNAIAESGLKREDLFITTKIPDCNVTNVVQYIRDDLTQLGMSYVDLMLIHAPRRGGDCLATWKILEEYFRSNQTRAIGVSNFGPSDLEPLLNGGTIVPHVNQIKLNLFEYSKDTIRYSTNHGIAVEAYSPLGRGDGQVVHHPCVQSIAQSHNVTGYQIALKWILQHDWILTFQSSSQEHQATDADVFGFELTQEEMEELDQISAIIIRHRVDSDS